MCLFDSQILFCKRAGSVGVNAIKHHLKRLWPVAIATILSKTPKIHFLFMSAVAHNWSLSPNLDKRFGPYRGYHSTLNMVKYPSPRPTPLFATLIDNILTNSF